MPEPFPAFIQSVGLPSTSDDVKRLDSSSVVWTWPFRSLQPSVQRIDWTFGTFLSLIWLSFQLPPWPCVVVSVLLTLFLLPYILGRFNLTITAFQACFLIQCFFYDNPFTTRECYIILNPFILSCLPGLGESPFPASAIFHDPHKRLIASMSCFAKDVLNPNSLSLFSISASHKRNPHFRYSPAMDWKSDLRE